MKLIYLSQGKFTIVDDDDFEILSCYKWSYSIGYAMRKAKGKTVYMHRIVCNVPLGLEVDHINHNKLDNRKQNIRLCTHAENNRNRPSHSKYRFRGIDKRGKNSWRAIIYINHKAIRVESLKTPEEAAKVYDELAKEFHKEFALTNF